jgi:hypothetical protein
MIRGGSAEREDVDRLIHVRAVPGATKASEETTAAVKRKASRRAMVPIQVRYDTLS